MFKGLFVSIPVAASAIVLLAHLCLPRFLLPDQITTTFIAVGAGIISSYILLGMPLHWLLRRIRWRGSIIRGQRGGDCRSLLRRIGDDSWTRRSRAQLAWLDGVGWSLFADRRLLRSNVLALRRAIRSLHLENFRGPLHRSTRTVRCGFPAEPLRQSKSQTRDRGSKRCHLTQKPSRSTVRRD
jgi:hypothetical protein